MHVGVIHTPGIHINIIIVVSKKNKKEENLYIISKVTSKHKTNKQTKERERENQAHTSSVRVVSLFVVCCLKTVFYSVVMHVGVIHTPGIHINMKLICVYYNYYSGVKEKQEGREFIYYKQSKHKTNKQTKRERERRKPDTTTAVMTVC